MWKRHLEEGSKPSSYVVTKMKIKEFVEAIGDKNPLYTNERYGRKTRFGGIIAPPTFVIACNFWVPDFNRRARRGSVGHLTIDFVKICAFMC